MKIKQERGKELVSTYLDNKIAIGTYHISYIYSTTKHEILQISNHNLLCSLDPPNQGWLF